MIRKVIISTLMMVVAVLGLSISNASAQYTPSLEITPIVPVGGKVTITGTGFTPGSTATVTLTDKNGNTQTITDIPVKDDGTFTVTRDLAPNMVPGDATGKGTDTSGRTADDDFQIVDEGDSTPPTRPNSPGAPNYPGPPGNNPGKPGTPGTPGSPGTPRGGTPPSSGGGGILPRTGSDFSKVALTGAAIAAVGAVALFISRRRKGLMVTNQ